MLELSRQKLKEDLYNVGAFAIETYGALQIQVTKEDTVREIDSEYFYRTEKKNLQQIDKYYLVVGEENFIYSSNGIIRKTPDLAPFFGFPKSQHFSARGGVFSAGGGVSEPPPPLGNP